MMQPEQSAPSFSDDDIHDKNNNNNKSHNKDETPVTHWEATCALAVFLLTPLAVTGYTPVTSISDALLFIRTFWTSQIRCSVELIVAITSVVAIFVSNKRGSHVVKGHHHSQYTTTATTPNKPTTLVARLKTMVTTNMTPYKLSLLNGIVIAILVLVTSQLQMTLPSTLWNPFMFLKGFRFYDPSELPQAMQGMCLDYEPKFRQLDITQQRKPLCLNRHQWDVMSSGGLSSDNPEDVTAVLHGISYAKEESGGLIVNVMARDTKEHIPALKQNVEALKQFFPKLAIVVFENDSVDGTREVFKQWAKEATGYKIDLISCGDDNPDCHLHNMHRYHSQGSIVGKMGEFRQTILDHVLQSEEYNDYSHMLILDHDLGANISPLGVMHTLGKLPNHPVAVTGEMVFPGSWGSLTFPYDVSAFRAADIPQNDGLVRWHSKFCSVRPPQDKWANLCEGTSPFQLNLILLPYFQHAEDPYLVESAFNGAALYPMKVIRESNAHYDTGTYGQRNEHIGFSFSLKTLMYVNPKWKLHVHPLHPPGPQDFEGAMEQNAKVIMDPLVLPAIVVPLIISLVLLAHAATFVAVYAGHHISAMIAAKTAKDSELPMFDSPAGSRTGLFWYYLFGVRNIKAKSGV